MSATVNYNPNAPTVEITHSLSGTQTAAFDIMVTFSEAVEGFMAGDISLTGVNASASIGTPTGFIYPVTITPTSDGTLTIFMEAGVVMDAVDMEDDYNVASNVVTVVVDVLAPRVTVIAPDAHNNWNAFDVTITFSEDVTGFDPSDLTLTYECNCPRFLVQSDREDLYRGDNTHDCGWKCGYGNNPRASRCCTRWC